MWITIIKAATSVSIKIHHVTSNELLCGKIEVFTVIYLNNPLDAIIYTVIYLISFVWI